MPMSIYILKKKGGLNSWEEEKSVVRSKYWAKKPVTTFS
jgi:hypothetical protein